MFVSSKSKVAGAAGLLALTIGCGGINDRAGGSGIAEPVVLTMAQVGHEPPEQLVSWAGEVESQSEGAVQIEFANEWRAGETDAEIGTIGDVRGGEVDLAWVGARAFDRVGVLSFQPLLAPLLVDSHDLQGAVFEAGVPTEMLDELDELDLAGIGVLPGPMRKVLGVTQPFLAPRDFAGQVVGIGTSDLAAWTMEALGATPQDLPGGASLDGLDAMDQQLMSIVGNRYARKGADYVSVNVNLWPRPLVLFMNGEAFDALTDDQQGALRDAAATAVDDALADSRAEDSDAVPLLCQEGMTLSVASDEQLAQLRRAVEPVYQRISSDHANEEWLGEITTIKSELAAPADSAQCPATVGDDASADSGFPQGTFEATIRAEDYTAKGWESGGATGTFRFVIDDATITLFDPPDGEAGFVGHYTVFRDRIEATDNTDTVTANWSFDGEQLTFTNVTPEQTPFEVVWESQPLTMVESAAEDDATALDGTYTWTITPDDAIANGFEDVAWLPCTWTVRLNGGEWTMEESCASDIADGTYEVFRDRVVFTWFNGFEQAFAHTVDNDGTLTLTPEPGMPEGDAFVWSTKPWERVGD
jgi:TRAP-type C4-dicarboxylate transport system substrate-binding protein